MSRPTFQVIDGGAQRASPWIELPKTVIAKSHIGDGNPVVYRLSRVDPMKALAAGRRQPLLDAWSAVIGKSPPVNGVSIWNPKLQVFPLTSVYDAHACFRGIKRPVGEDDSGWDRLAYVSRPRLHFRYRADMACVVEPVAIPDDLVFVTYVRLDFPSADRNSRSAENVVPSGIVTHWQFVESDSLNLGLPINHGNRYRKRLW